MKRLFYLNSLAYLPTGFYFIYLNEIKAYFGNIERTMFNLWGTAASLTQILIFMFSLCGYFIYRNEKQKLLEIDRHYLEGCALMILARMIFEIFTLAFGTSLNDKFYCIIGCVMIAIAYFAFEKRISRKLKRIKLFE